MTHWEIAKAPPPPDEHNQDESTLYISDPSLEGCSGRAGINSFLIVCSRGQSFTPQKSGEQETAAATSRSGAARAAAEAARVSKGI